MASKKDATNNTPAASSYQRVRVLSSEDYPRIARMFAKLQIIGGVLASKLGQIFTGFYIYDIYEEWCVESQGDSSPRDRVLCVRLCFRLKCVDKKMLHQFEEIQSTNVEVPPTDEILKNGVVEQ